jgi:nitroreductase
MDAAICAPSGGNRQGWSFLVIRDAAKRARLGELYREAWDELMKTPYYRGASAASPDSREGKMVASAGHLAEHLAEAPVLVLACIGTDGARPTITTGASIYPAVQNLMLAARARHWKLRHHDPQVPRRAGEGAARHPRGRRDGGADPTGLSAREVRAPPRRPLAEVAHADRWGQAF